MSPQTGAGHGDDREVFIEYADGMGGQGSKLLTGPLPGERPEEVAKLRNALDAVRAMRANETASETRPRVAVGGSLHGLVMNVPINSSVVYADRGVSVEVLQPGGTVDDEPNVQRFRATQDIELYQVRDVGRTSAGNVGLIIASDLLKSANAAKGDAGLDRSIVEALGIAAGVFGSSPALVRQLVDVEAIRKSEGFNPTE